MINQTVLVGRLTRDPQLKRTQSNISYVRFTLAVNRSFTDESGERQADFISCIAWRAQAENLARFMKQGSLIGLVGRIQTGSYESDKGTIYTTDVVADNIQFLESKPKQDNNDNGYYEQDISSDLPF
jgi:single-strand DNA-binding protein